jgi:hypothetical protein
MRFGAQARPLLLVLLLGGCLSSQSGGTTNRSADAEVSACLGGAKSGGGGTGGSGAFCSTSGRCDDSNTSWFCTLDGAIALACQAGENGALIYAAKFTYVQLFNVDVADVYVYDKAGAFVASLRWGANSTTGCHWSCAGPPDFDPSEAITSLPVVSQSPIQGCQADATID